MLDILKDDSSPLPLKPTRLDARVAARTAALSEALAVVEAQKRELELALEARDATQRQLEQELSDARLLHGISAMLVDEDTIGALYQRIVDAATQITRSDFGSMQRFDAERHALELIAHHGLDDEAVAFWQWVQPGRPTTCGKALQVGARVVVGDFDTCDFIAGSEDHAAFRKAGVRSAQSTPLLTRDGRLIGMITTHWTREHAPQARELQLLDIVARQAADLIERSASAAALRTQAEQLRTADRYKDEFLATLAHELRNPLAPIRTGMSILTLGSPEQAPRVLPIMERQLGQMVRLIDDLLDVSRISRGKVTLKCTRIALAAVIDSAVEASRPLIDAAGHRFTVTVPETPVWLDADFTRLTQVVSNLINNAAKYTPHGGQISLAASVDDGAVLVRIADNGIGIAPAMLPKIFDLFTQVDGTMERAQGGLGVGLALARRLAEMHGGDIRAESPGPDAGAVFTLALPLAPPAGAAAAAPRILQAPPEPMRILVVDDNADAADTLAMLLAQLGHAVQVVLDSSEALTVARAFQPEVVFMDIGMPKLNGYDLASRLRAEPSLAHVYIAAISGWGTEEDRARGRKAGFDAHLTKPALLSDVNDVLVTAVQAEA